MVKKLYRLNIMLRTKGKIEFENQLFKLMNNSVYGMTLENVSNYKQFILVNNENTTYIMNLI